MTTRIVGMLTAVAALVTAAPASAANTGATHEKKRQAKMGNLVETAAAAGSFTTLAKALEAAGLDETLKGKGPFTVFAPTDEAFAALPAGALDGLLADKEKLKAVLLTHVVPGRVTAAEVMKLSSAKTAEGSSLSIAKEGGKVTVGDAEVVKTDVMASNGVIHVIDKVILPAS